MKKIIKLTLIAALITVLLCACSSQPASTVTQADLGPEPENITEETILGRWYFKGIETEYIDFYDDGTYSLDFDGEITEGQWWFNDACTICFMDDYGEAWIEVYYDASSWEITGLEYVSEMYYPG